MEPSLRKLIALIVGGMLFLTAYGAKAQQQQPATPVDVTIGWASVGASTAQALILAEKLYEKFMPSARVKLVEFQSGAASLSAIQSGSVQFIVEIGNPPVTTGIARGLPIQVIWVKGVFLTAEGLVARKDSGIRSVQDLRSKTVATVVGSTSGYMLHSALTSVNVPPSQVRILNMDPTSMLAAWQKKQIDAAYIWEPVFSKLAKDNGEVIATNKDFLNVAASVDFVIVNSDWAAAHPDLVRNLLQAEREGVRRIRENRAQSLQKMAEFLKITVPEVEQELNGVQLMDAEEQLSPEGLGQGAGIKSSRMTKVLSGTGSYLQAVGTLKSALDPNMIADHVVTKYIEK